MTMPIVYYKPGCPFGIRLRLSLRLHGAAFHAVRFRDDQEGAAMVRALNHGDEISPTVRVDDTWLINPHWREVVHATGDGARSCRVSARPCLPDE